MSEAEEFVKWAESQIIVGRSTSRAFSVTDEPYVTLTNGGVKEEGKGVVSFVGTPEEAWDGLRAVFTAYEGSLTSVPSTNPYVLYWRTHPTIEKVHDRNILTYQARTRLLISNKSVEKEMLPGMRAIDAMDYEKQAKEKTRDKALGLDDLSLRMWAVEQAVGALRGRDLLINDKQTGITAAQITSFALAFLQWVKGDPKARKNG